MAETITTSKRYVKKSLVDFLRNEDKTSDAGIVAILRASGIGNPYIKETLRTLKRPYGTRERYRFLMGIGKEKSGYGK